MRYAIFVATFIVGIVSPLFHAHAITPRPPKAAMIKVAPERCLFFFHSLGFTTAESGSSNKTEQLFADPDIRRFIDEVISLADDAVEMAIQENQEGDDAEKTRQFYKLAKLLVGQPMTFYVGDIDVDAKKIDAGFIIDGGEHIDELKSTVLALQKEADDGLVSTVEVGGIKSYLITPKEEEDPPLYWTVTGSTLVVTVGDDSLANLLSRIKTPPPTWLKTLVERLPVPRKSAISYLNGKELARLVAKAPDPKGAEAWQALGWDQIESAAFVAGLDEDGFLTRGLVSAANLQGLMEIWDGQGFSQDDLTTIPANTTFAAALQMSPAKILTSVESMMAKLDPNAAQEMQANLQQSAQMLGFDVRNELINTLGDRWLMYQVGLGAMMTPNMVISVNLVDAPAFEGSLGRIVQLAKQAMAAQEGGQALSIQETMIGEHQGFVLQGLPVAPTWGVAGDHFLIGTSPGQLKTHIAARGSAGNSLAGLDRIEAIFSTENKPIFVAYSDLKTNLTNIYPMMQMGLNMGVGQLKQKTGLDFDLGAIPSVDSITKYLDPSVFSIQRVDDGLEFTADETLPQVSITGVSGPVAVALLLPAVQAARSAARRNGALNNMRQIMLALLNHESAKRAFPVASQNGLSWRVHILPFIGEQELYDRFDLTQPWDSDHNKQLINQMPSTYVSPVSDLDPEEGKTNYLAIRADSSVIVDASKGTSVNDISDGMSRTIVAVEVDDERAVVWTQPEDYTYDSANPIAGMGSLHAGGVFVAGFADGHTEVLPITVNKDQVKAMYTRNGGEVVEIAP